MVSQLLTGGEVRSFVKHMGRRKSVSLYMKLYCMILLGLENLERFAQIDAYIVGLEISWENSYKQMV